MERNPFSQFLETLKSSSEFETADKALTDALKAIGIDKFAYTYYGTDFHNNTKLTYDYATPNLRKWHDYFHAMQYEGIDDTTQEVRDSIIPHVWVVQEQHDNASGKAKEMFADAMRFGMKSGMSLPIHGPGSEFSILTVQHDDIKKLLAQNPHLSGIIYQYTLHYHNQINTLLLKEVQHKHDCPLTARELQCLQFADKNYDAEHTAKELNVKKRTIDFHFENINKKLNSKNKFAALQIAREKDWI